MKQYGINTNAIFAEKNKEFQVACEAAGIAPTKRQASKYRNKRGLAYRHRHLKEVRRGQDSIH